MKNKMQEVTLSRETHRAYRLKETNSRSREVQSVTGQLSCLHGEYSNRRFLGVQIPVT